MGLFGKRKDKVDKQVSVNGNEDNELNEGYIDIPVPLPPKEMAERNLGDLSGLGDDETKSRGIGSVEEGLPTYRPTLIEEPFLRKNKFMGMFGGGIDLNIKQPVLFLQRNDGYTDPIQGVKAGEFIINTTEGNKSILLSPNKLTTLRNGDQYIKCWFCHEDIATPLPEEPLHTSLMLNKQLQKLYMNYQDRVTSKMLDAKGRMWLMILGGVGLLLVLLFSSPEVRSVLMGALGGSEGASQVVQNITENVTTVIRSVN